MFPVDETVLLPNNCDFRALTEGKKMPSPICRKPPTAWPSLQPVLLAVQRDQDRNHGGGGEGDQLQQIELQSKRTAEKQRGKDQHRDHKKGNLQAGTEGNGPGEVHLILFGWLPGWRPGARPTLPMMGTMIMPTKKGVRPRVSVTASNVATKSRSWRKTFKGSIHAWAGLL